MSRPNISIFTPTHGDSAYLAEAWQSIKAQTYEDWEWVVLINNSTVTTLPIDPDPRIRFVYDTEGVVQGVGHAKRLAVAECKGDILVELDHDDLLTPDALAHITEAFNSYPGASLVYSRFAQVQADGSPHPQRFDASHGWEYDEADGLLVPRLLKPTPHNVSLIWYAPNHVRAFRLSSYEATTGYDPSLSVLDDLALMAQLFQVGEFVALDVMLYKQRMHGANTQLDLETNRKIQTGTWDLYEQNVLANYRAWARRKSLSVALTPKEIRVREDLRPSSFGLLRYCGDDGGYLNGEAIQDAHHLLAPNGLLAIFIPEGVPLNEHYFRAWCSTDSAMFQESRIATWEIGGRKWVQANLIAVKEGYTREGGVLHAKGMRK
jgi:glycosyltransferase involved in cell wall biosynthesis